MERIRSLRPSRRKHYRISAPIEVTIGDQVLETTDWSSGGFRIDGFPGPKPEDPIEVLLSIPFQGFAVAASATCACRRWEEEGGVLSVEFIDLEERTRELLEYFAAGLLSGEMASVEGAIHRLDTPVTPVETKLERDERETRWSFQFRRWARYAAYLLVGAGLSWYVANSLYDRVWRLQVYQASVASAAEDMLSPVAGVIDQLHVEEGQWVETGEPLFSVVDSDASTKAADAAERIQQAELVVQQTTALLDVEKRKMESYRNVLQARLSASESRLDLLDQQATLLQRQQERERKLLETGASSVRQLEQSEAAYMAVMAEVESVKREVSVDRANLAALDDGFLIDGVRLQANLPELEAQLSFALDQVLLEQRAAELPLAASSREILAPFAGRVSRLPRAAGSIVEQGAPIVVLEPNTIRHVEAWLTPDEAAFVKLGDTVEVEIKAEEHRFRGEVIALSTAWGDTQQSGLLENDPKLRAVIALTGFAEDEDPQVFQELMADWSLNDNVGLLAQVTFHRAW